MESSAVKLKAHIMICLMIHMDNFMFKLNFNEQNDLKY